MKPMPKPAPKLKLSPLDRAIRSREHGLAKLERRKKYIMEDAAERCAEIDKLIATRKVLLDAIKRGALKP